MFEVLKGSFGMKRTSANVVVAILMIGLAPLKFLAAPVQSPAGEQPSTYDDIWKFSQWYENEDNPVVQSLLFSGRFQHEYAAVSDDGASHSEWNVRRLRLGVKTRLFDQFTLHTEAEFNPQERDPVYMRLTDFYLEWSRSGRMALTFGKQGVGFTMDGSTSSKELLTIDRSNLTNNMWFTQEYMPGVSVSGTLSNWVYHVGAFSAGEGNREFGRFNGSYFGLAVIGYDFADSMGVREALLTGNYVYQNPDSRNTSTRQLQHVGSVNFKFEDDRWGFRSDFSVGSGYLGQSDLWGVMTMPFVNVTRKFQVVGRHTYMKSENPNGVRLARYENRAISGRGDEYSEVYLGVNYYFYGHKLKLQSGVQFGEMTDSANDGGTYSGVSSTTGLRVSW
jgi:phosphate-selective porin OprO/OprP